MDLDSTKFIVRTVASFCVGGTVTMLIKQNVIPETKFKKTELAIGTTTIGLMVSEQVGQHTDRWIDEIASMFETKRDPYVVHQ